MATSPISVTISGAASDDSVAYSIIVRNSSDKAVSNVYVAGSIPAGATFSAASVTPKGAGFLGSSGGVVAWAIGSVPAKGSAGPFVYKAAIANAQALAANGFAHWAVPSDGTAASASVTPISNSERLALEQAINDKLNNVDNTLTLWSMQPGTGPRMADLARHFNLMWFAAQAGNWSMAEFEVGDQVPGTVSRIKIRNSGLAASLDNWNNTGVAPPWRPLSRPRVWHNSTQPTIRHWQGAIHATPVETM